MNIVSITDQEKPSHTMSITVMTNNNNQEPFNTKIKKEFDEFINEWRDTSKLFDLEQVKCSTKREFTNEASVEHFSTNYHRAGNEKCFQVSCKNCQTSISVLVDTPKCPNCFHPHFLLSKKYALIEKLRNGGIFIFFKKIY